MTSSHFQISKFFLISFEKQIGGTWYTCLHRFIHMAYTRITYVP